DAVGDAVAVGDDQRRAVVRLRLEESPDGLPVIGAHGHRRHVDVAVLHGDGRQVLLGLLLPLGGELGDGAPGRRLGGLPARVGVHLGIQHEDVDVGAGGQDVVKAAVTDVVGPAV